MGRPRFERLALSYVVRTNKVPLALSEAWPTARPRRASKGASLLGSDFGKAPDLKFINRVTEREIDWFHVSEDIAGYL